jgi:ornithine cyclodeaminase/alanine dehydrogenase-like protein (mu-crystallin family)
MLGIRALAERPIESLGIVGCGRQGHVHLELAEEIFPTLRRVTLFDRHRDRAEELAAAHPKLEAEVASAAEGIAPGADVVVSTAAIVRQPERPLRRAHMKEAMVACAVDFDATLSEDLFEDAGMFVVDDLAQYRYYRQQGYFAGYPTDALELADVLADETPRPRGLKVYVPLGLGLEDVAVAAELNRRAAGTNLGVELTL